MMRGQKSIYDMTDRELRAYKRELRRRIAWRRRVAFILATIALVCVCVVSYNSLSSNAQTELGEVSYKYYTGITVQSSDTLWSIADEYMDDSQYSSRQDYIAEVCSINRLEDAGDLVAGRMLVVPYYSTEYVR